ncbi:MAG TPA: helix-turn-helix domain-containing protein [Candidatus Bathyarchaeia archaeon]|nr:helix-turn-helix domain-containing protein [Candidatus Bathyarchaeia archaeon]
MPADIVTLFSEFGLKKEAGEVYLHLLQTGRRTAGEVAESLHLTSHRANKVLLELSKQGLAKRISTNPETFVAAYPAPLLNPAINKEAAKLQSLSEARDTLLELWDVERTKAQGLPVEWCPIEEGFIVLYDKDDIIDRRLETFHATEKRLWIISTEFWLLRWDKVLHDYFVGDEDKCRIEDLRILLPITPNNIDAVKQLSTCFKIRHSPMMSNFAVVISDCKEAMYTGVTKDLDELERVELTPSLWSNNSGFIEIQSSLFQSLWDKAIDARLRIQEIETGKPIEVTRVITDYKEILEDFASLINTAQKEIFLWSRSEALPILAPLIPKDARQRGIDVIVMAEITKDNLQAAQEIAERADVRHIPQIVHSTGVIIDQQAMQVLLYSFSEKGAELYNSIYTNTKSFVETQHSMMEDMWHSGIELRYREEELTAGRVVQTIQVIKKRENVYKAFYEMLDRSKNEFNVIQTRMGVKRLYNLLKDREMPKITYRLLAPIESVNIEEARLLTKYFEIRHLESETGAGIFISDDDKLLGTSYIYDTGDIDKVIYKSAFRTDISEFIFIEKELFNSFWYNATPLSIREQELPIDMAKGVIDAEKPEKRPARR